MQNNNNSRNSNRRKRNRSRKQKDLGKAAEDAQRGVANLKRRSRARAPNQIDAVGTFENPKQVSYKNSNSQLSTVNQKLMSSYCRQYFDYLATVAHPWHVTNAMIPDWTTFPRGTAQVRTVGTITTGNNPGDDTFVLTLIPCLRKSGTLDTTGAVGLPLTSRLMGSSMAMDKLLPFLVFTTSERGTLPSTRIELYRWESD